MHLSFKPGGGGGGAVADTLKFTIEIVESNHGFAPLTTVNPVQERNTSYSLKL